jgi:hypothetical protein
MTSHRFMSKIKENKSNSSALKNKLLEEYNKMGL